MSAILIVDHNHAVRRDLGDALEAAGFKAVPCGTIAEARTALRMQQLALAILDVRLPDGDGIELLAQIRREPTLSTLPVLILSSEAQVADRIRALRQGANDYVGKPHDATEIVARVRQLIGGPPVRDLVLVIDHDPVFLGELAQALTAAGFAAATAPNGAAGLQLASTARPTAVIAETTLPDIDGTSLIRRLRLDPALRTTPCLLLGPVERDAEVRALEAGADGFVGKSDLAIVIARLKAMLRGAPPAHVEGRSLLAPKRILAVDDDPDFLLVLGDRLRKRGYDVVRATSGEEALQLLEVQVVDCILLDRSMTGIGGVETCRRLKASPWVRDTPVIILTATDAREALLEGLAAGAEDFIAKGAGFEALCARLHAQIRRKQMEDEQRRVHAQQLRWELEASDARTARDRAEARATHVEQVERRNAELTRANTELEAFSYTVGHDLRAPLRTVGAFTRAVIEDLGDRLDERALEHFRRVLAATSRMGERIDALLELSRVNVEPLGRHPVDLSGLALASLDELARRHPDTEVTAVVEPNLVIEADARLIRIALDNLIDNAWKFTAGTNGARIELGVDRAGEEPVYYVRGNGGHVAPSTGAAFCGTLATVRRIVERHGGRVWAETAADGAQVSFTLPQNMHLS